MIHLRGVGSGAVRDTCVTRLRSAAMCDTCVTCVRSGLVRDTCVTCGEWGGARYTCNTCEEWCRARYTRDVYEEWGSARYMCEGVQRCVIHLRDGGVALSLVHRKYKGKEEMRSERAIGTALCRI